MTVVELQIFFFIPAINMHYCNCNFILRMDHIELTDADNSVEVYLTICAWQSGVEQLFG